DIARQRHSGKARRLALGDHVCDRGGGRVGKTQMEARNVAARGELCGFSVELDGRGMAALARDFDFTPANVAVPSGAHRLHRGLFCGESRGITLKPSPPSRLAVSDFALGENTGAKTLASVWARQRTFDTFNFDQINSSTDDRHAVPRGKYQP